MEGNTVEFLNFYKVNNFLVERIFQFIEKHFYLLKIMCTVQDVEIPYVR